MKIYKFGGASVKDAQGVRNLHKIVAAANEPLCVVISAMGKTTNALECVANSFFEYRQDSVLHLDKVKQYHETIVNELFTDRTAIDELLKILYDKLDSILKEKPSLCYDFEYDRIVAFGELISTTIVAQYLKEQGMDAQWIDVRDCIITDSNFRCANVDLEISSRLVKKAVEGNKLTITQGFIAGTTTNQTTTLGREGSDYTAAILANILDAESVTIWKDVPGVMTADPKLYDNVQIIPVLSYKEAIELSYCGASVIHPKTVKPLQNKDIPLHVKSFIEPEKEGSLICNYPERLELPPIYINKRNLVLLSLTPRDFSFIAEEKLSKIFAILASYRVKLSVIQTAAISFSLCIDYDKVNFEKMINEFRDEYKVLYNTDVELITIRHYNEEVIEKLIHDRVVYVEQRSRLTARFVMPVQ